MSLLWVYLRERYCRSAGRAALMEISAKTSTAVADSWLMLTVLLSLSLEVDAAFSIFGSC